MESVWEHDTPHARFWRQLLQQNADQRRLDEEYLKRLRFQPARAKEDQKRFGDIWAEHNTNIYKLIASACGEVWDNEDEEKHGGKSSARTPWSQRSRESASALQKTGCIPTKGNDNLDRAREESPRSRQHQFQGIPQAGECILEGEKGQESPEKRRRPKRRRSPRKRSRNLKKSEDGGELHSRYQRKS